MNFPPPATNLTIIILLSLFKFAHCRTIFTTSVLQTSNSTDFTFPFSTALIAPPTDASLLIVANGFGILQLLRLARLPTGYKIASTLSTVSLSPGRSVLSLSSDPFDPSAIFVSTSILSWRDQGLPESGWQNGQILRVSIVNDKLVLDEEPVVSGLPVSLGRGAVYGSVVDPFTGRLFVSVGSFTNGGVPNEAEGNLAENMLSATILDINVREGPVELQWSSSDVATAMLTKGEDKVVLFATGLRSLYQPVVSRFNYLFGIDGGANDKSSEPRSLGCMKSRPFRRSMPDKIIRVRRGQYYGFPNRALGKCVFVSPLLDPDVAVKRFEGYTPPLFTNEDAIERGDVGSGSTGSAFYGANYFAGFRGALLGADSDTIESSGSAERKEPGLLAFLVRKKEAVRVGDMPGISLTVNAFGAVFGAQSQRGLVGVSIPGNENDALKRKGILNVFPERGLPGSIVFICGAKFGKRPVVRIGNKKCTGVQQVRKMKLIRCTVPTPERFQRRPFDVSIGRMARLKLAKAYSIMDASVVGTSTV